MLTVKTASGQRNIEVSGTVLQSLEEAKVHHVSHCRSGFCGACRCKAKGSVKYIADPIGFTRPGEILPCIAIPESDLEIEVAS